MSNLADLLKQISGSNSTAINLVGNVLGVLADVSGGVGAVVGLIGLFVANDDTIASRLNDIETEIQRDFAVLNAEQRAQNILNRLNSLDPPVAQAQTVVDQLQDDLNQNPPVSEEYRLQQIGLCLDAVEQLNQDDKWLSVFLDEIYYGQNETDLWAGTVAPAANADGTIFSDRYILPYYLRVLYDLMLVATAFEPGYQTHYKDSLQRFTARLQTVYDISRLGIVTIRTPTPSEIGIVNGRYYHLGPSSPLDLLDGPIGQSQWHSPYIGSDRYYNHATVLELEDGYFQEYGVVHTYSGYSNISYYPPIPLPTIAPDVFLLEFFAKLNLAIRRNWKDAYVAIGLATVWKTLKVLRILTGDAPPAAFDPGSTWSLREINQILGSAFRDPSVPIPPEISGMDTISRLAMAGGLSVSRPLSWRDALSAALKAATITPAPPEPYAPIGTY